MNKPDLRYNLIPEPGYEYALLCVSPQNSSDLDGWETLWVTHAHMGIRAEDRYYDVVVRRKIE